MLQMFHAWSLPKANDFFKEKDNLEIYFENLTPVSLNFLIYTGCNNFSAPWGWAHKGPQGIIFWPKNSSNNFLLTYPLT